MNPRVRGAKRGSRGLRNLLIVLALLSVVAFGAASRLRAPDPVMVTVPDSGGAYVEAVVGSANILNPILLNYNQVDRDISSLIFSGLTKLDDNGLIVPDLAERWETGDGGKSYTFYLRRDVRWHDRTPFTSDDVLFTINSVQSTEFQGNAEVADIWRNATVTQVDDFTIRFTLKEAYAAFLEYTTMGILPRHLYSEAAGKAMPTSLYNLRPIGTGPFKLVKFTAEGITLEPHPDYYGPAPMLGQLQFRFYPDYQTALAALEKDEVDAMAYLEPQDAVRLQASEKLAVNSVPEYYRYSVLFINNSNPVFKDKAVRQAVAHAVSKDRLVEMVMQNQAVSGKGPIAPSSWAFDPGAKGYEYDPKKAQDLLDSAGWRDSDGDGVREKDGAALSFVILTNDNSRRVKTGEMIVEDLKKVGFKAEVQALAWTDLMQKYMANRTFAAVLAEQWLLTSDPDVRPMWHSSQIAEGGFNFSGLNNPQVDKLLDEASQVEDRTRRAQLYSEFQRLWAEEVPS
ncbi:MAG TPA: ABC transporter substrate-binding protein, partial [Chloroflexota bacterium]|nr:ABC transporter substrate-binding protein [Chloroflexota bacterium]